jgi:ABC-type Fe3+/spermidine/putrescine transport system ATPase subunit
MLSVRNLSKSFDGRTVLDSIDLDINRGEIFTILGDSGCGKTTLLRILAGLETPDRGRITLDTTVWADVGQRTLLPPQKRGIGLVFQSYAIWPHLTVAENIAYPLRRRGVARAEIAARVEDVLTTVGLQGFGPRPATQLSGGQQQRVAMARALAPRPNLLLLDEPFSNLDVGLRGQLRSELKDIQQRFGLTIILVTHDQLDAFTLSDRVALFRNGHVDQIGSPQELYEQPASDYARRFIGRSSAISADMSHAPDGSLVARLKGGQEILFSHAAHPTPSAHTAVNLWIRPEDVLLDTAQAPGALLGHVRQSTFIGDRFETLIELSGGAEVTAYQHRSQPYPSGTPISVRFAQPPVIATSSRT